MANNNVDTEALEQAGLALSVYIDEVGKNIQKMQDAATDCSDNMGSDVYSQSAIQKLATCAAELSKTLQLAQDLKDKILAKKRNIEDSQTF
ncbi:hypothetical protein [Fusibacter bizertensis]